MNSLLKRSFVGNLARFSFLSVSSNGTRERKKKQKKKQAFAKVRFSYSFSLWCNENNQCKFKTERSRFLIESIMSLRTVSAACIFTSDNCHFSNF